MKLLNLVLSLLALLAISNAFARLPKGEVDRLSHLNLTGLKSELRTLVSHNHDSLGYDRAKETIFKKIDNREGEVCCVYSNAKCLRVSSVPNHKVMNVEHTWPQSHGARGTAKSDLHHLFPTTSQINSTRSNFPFCEVTQVKWEGDGSKMGKNANGTICFEPPEHHKGDVARAMFYFAIRYSYEIDSDQEKVLRKWNRIDPVDTDELERHQLIVRYQRNINVFIENPELIDDISDF